MLPGNAVIGERLHALAGVGQFLRANHTDGDDLFGVKLVRAEKHLQTALVAAPAEHPEGFVRILAGDPHEQLVQGIAAVSGLLPIAEHQPFEVGPVGEKVRSNMPVKFSKAEETFDPAGIEKPPDLYFDLFDHKEPFIFAAWWAR
jgi:hypothetical protein